MKSNLEEKLYNDYPELFYNFKNDSTREITLMFGVECEDGWYSIIDNVCKELLRKSRIEREKPKTAEEYEESLETFSSIPKIIQIKEKFGTLRVYLNYETKEQQILLDEAQKLSSKVCEFCGSTKEVKLSSSGWRKTLCPEHMKMFYGTENP